MHSLSNGFSKLFSLNKIVLTRAFARDIKLYVSSSAMLKNKEDNSSEHSDHKLPMPPLPEKPKKPATSFIRFVMAVRPLIQKNHPDIAKTDQIKYAAKMWENSSVEVRTQYQIEYYTELEKYLDNVQKYRDSLTEEQFIALKKIEKTKKENRNQKKIKEKLKEFDKPKRPLNAFTLYLLSRKDELKKINAQSYSKKLAEEWKQLPEGKKNKFRQESKIHQDEYYKKLAEWKDRISSLNVTEVLKNENIEEIKEFPEEKKEFSEKNSVKD